MSHSIRFRDHTGQEFSYDACTIADRLNSSAFVRFYDAADVRSDNTMAPLDWSVPALLQAPIRRYALLKYLVADSGRAWQNCDDSLSILGSDVGLESEDSLPRRRHLQACLEAFMETPGIGASIATKILHKKRPALVPVIDNFVTSVLIGRRGFALDAEAVTALIYDVFRPHLLGSIAAVDDVVSRVDQASLSRCRVLDFTVWAHAFDHRQAYGLR